jgi:adenylylsulfate kinase-like enzyme/TATA-box binding protein (TBP) (component of TFIID and TFIIIB)
MTALMPRRLGLPARAQISNDDPKASVPQRERYEWLESRLREFKHLEAVNAQTVLEQRLPEQGVIVIVGEPGAGKSVLAATWRNYFETQKRTCILLEGGSLEAKLESGENILLKMAEHPRARVSKATKAALKEDGLPDHALLIIDALDELPNALHERLAQKILEIAQRHPVILTCRTAVWVNRAKAIYTQTPISQTYTLMGFTPDEQREYLREWATEHQIDPERAATIASEVQSRPQLSYLAANPLMLTLIAQVTLEASQPVPDSRAELYGKAIAHLWKKAHRHNDPQSWGSRYEPFMRALALASVRDEQLETELDWDTVEQALREADVPEAQHDAFLERLQDSGLVVLAGIYPDAQRRFIHLTLHEYALASAWLFGLRTPKTIQVNDLSARLQDKLLEHWWQPNFESTLSLALSITSKHGANLHDPIMAMLASWERGRPSALRTALHLVNAANVADQKVIDMLLEVLRTIKLGTLMAAVDPECPKDILTTLTTDKNSDSRYEAIINPNVSVAVLDKLAADEDHDIRWGIAKNPNTSASTLERLILDESRYVRRDAASHPNLPTDTLEHLATNQDSEMRLGAAQNPNMPVSELVKMAGEKDISIKVSAISNPNLPTNVLEKLATSQNITIRVGTSDNPKTDPATLEKFIADENAVVRRNAAKNPNMPANILEILVTHQDWDGSVRQGAAENPNTSMNALEKLVKDPDDLVRRITAKNLNISANALETLLTDHVELVRQCAVENPNLATETLEKLVMDENLDIRRLLDKDSNALTDPLDIFRINDYLSFRQSAAKNLSMSAKALEKLIVDEDLDICKEAAKNPNYIPETHPTYPHSILRRKETTLTTNSEPAKVFISYAHADEDLRKALEIHLSGLKRRNLVSIWHDREIGVGQEWKEEISEHLENADVILLLVSASFIASDYCYGIELQRAMERHEMSQARVIPVFVKPCNFTGLPFAKIQGTPTDAKAVTTWPNQDEAWMLVSQRIEAAIKEL